MATASAGLGRIHVVHGGVPGRLRLSLPGLYRRPDLVGTLELKLAGEPGVSSVRANPLTACVLLRFDPALGVPKLVARVVALTGALPPLETSAEPGAGPAPASRTAPRPSPGRIAAPVAATRGPAAKTADRRGLTPAGVEGAASTGFEPRGWHAMTEEQVRAALGLDSGKGLDAAQARSRLARFGPNRLDAAPARSGLAILMDQLLSVPVGMLGVSALVSAMTGGLADALVILAVVGINGVIGFLTESQAERTIRGLADLSPKTCRVMRAGEHQEVSAQELVPGDLVLLEPGSWVAADLRLTSTRELSVDESALTGESLPAEKDAARLLKPEAPIGLRSNMAFMGTAVTGGTGRGIAVGTARATEIGRIQSLLGEVRPPDTPMETQLDRLGSQLALLSGLVCVGVFFVGLVRGLGWLEMLKTSVSLAVAAVPEGLPTVATTTLALGVAEMRRRHVAVRHLDAVETLGSVQVLCLDKTGTLTQNRMEVARVLIGTGGGEGCADLRRRLLETVSLCSEARVGDGAGDGVADGAGEAVARPQGSATEVALLELALAEGLDVDALRRAHPLIELHQRAEGRPVMSSFHRGLDGGVLIAAKGSPGDLLDRCTHLGDPDTQLDDAARESILCANESMASDALRVLGVAYRRLGPGEAGKAPLATQGLTWLGLAGLSDALRPGMPGLMADFHRAGIKTVMITGDQGATAAAVGRTLGLSGRADLRVLDSSDLERLDPGMLRGLVPDLDCFARVSPAHKLRIVQAFQQAGRVVAMTGDGINDGPALKAADNGVAMGMAGTDLARSVADIVLEDDNLHTMLEAVAQGRTIYANIRKTVHFLLATNFSEIETMLAAIALGMGSPLNPMQLLWINLITDIFPGLALSMEPAEPDVLSRPPRDPKEPIVSASGLARMAGESAFITAGTMAAFVYGVARYGPGPAPSTLAFNTITLAQLLHSLGCRSQRPILSAGLPRNRELELAIGISLGVQALANLVPGLARLLGLVPMGPMDLLAVLGGAALPLLANESMKWANGGPAGPAAVARELEP